MAERPWPPVLRGPADAEPPVVGHLLDHPAHVRADAVAVGQLGLDLRGEQVGVVVAEAVPERLLFLGVADLHGGPSRLCQRHSDPDVPPARPWTVELRGRGLSTRAPWIPAGRRPTRSGWASAARLEHVTFRPAAPPPAARRERAGDRSEAVAWPAASGT